MGLEPTKLIVIGTRTTYQVTGDAGSIGTRHTDSKEERSKETRKIERKKEKKKKRKRGVRPRRPVGWQTINAEQAEAGRDNATTYKQSKAKTKGK